MNQSRNCAVESTWSSCLPPGEDRHLVQVRVEPRRRLGNMDKALLDQRGLRVHAHDLVACRLIARDRVAAVGDQLLDQLGARGLVLDQASRKRSGRSSAFRRSPKPTRYTGSRPIWGQECLRRRQGEALHPDREPLETLGRTRRTIGEYNFAGQYQQSPAPLGGGLVKAAWFKRYRDSERPKHFDRIVQSWDTANKATELSDFSVCTTWGVKGKNLFLIGLFRRRLEYPELKRAVCEQQSLFGANNVEPAVEGVVKPLVGGSPQHFGERVLRLQRIIDQDDVGAASSQHAAGRGGEPVALSGGDELLNGLPLRTEAGRKIRRYHGLIMIWRPSRANLSARSCA